MVILSLAGSNKLTKKHVNKIRNDIDTSWKNLGKRLNLPAKTIRTIDVYGGDTCNKVSEMLDKWMKKEGDNATISCLADALKKIGKDSLAQKLLHM